MPRLETLEDRTVPSGGYNFQPIDPPLAAQGSIPTLINNSGEIVGLYTDANAVVHGYLLSGGQYTTLDHPNAVGFSAAFGINDSGTIVGAYRDANGLYHGYLFSGGQYTTLDHPDGVLGNVAYAISDSENVVGVYWDANGLAHGYLATKAQEFSVLGSPGAAGGRGSTTTWDAVGSFAVAIPDLLPPAQARLSLPGRSPVAPSKPDPLPTRPEVSRVDQIFAEDRWSMEHRSFKPANPKPEGLPLDWQPKGPADDFAGTW